ncbi:MAG: PhoH family protein [Pseudomonadales bacterium]|nr:PhoH family protein [Pseudomonadales bacterium]
MDNETPEELASTLSQKTLALEPNFPRDLATLCGEKDIHIRQIEQRLDVSIANRGNQFLIKGTDETIAACEAVLQFIYAEVQQGAELDPEALHLSLSESSLNEIIEGNAATHIQQKNNNVSPINSIRTRRELIKPRGLNQQKYVQEIRSNDINFGVGPAGTGKTYLAVACAVEALEKEQVQRILLVRPAVEAGEKLGFLPGDLSQKVDPYLRPLYDALYEMIGFERVDKLIERNIIEVAPLAYMRGRTLNNAYIILDESQNTTREQMKMFLTRIGFGSTAVITGDITQVDLPRGTKSGLRHVIDILDGVNGISFTHFGTKDIVRHPLVARIVDAYESADKAEEKAAEKAGRKITPLRHTD